MQKYLYRITYKHGLHSPYLAEAYNIDDAKKIGLAEYRRNTGFVETVSMWTIDQVIDTVELVSENL